MTSSWIRTQLSSQTTQQLHNIQNNFMCFPVHHHLSVLRQCQFTQLILVNLLKYITFVNMYTLSYDQEYISVRRHEFSYILSMSSILPQMTEFHCSCWVRWSKFHWGRNQQEKSVLFHASRFFFTFLTVNTVWDEC